MKIDAEIAFLLHQQWGREDGLTLSHRAQRAVEYAQRSHTPDSYDRAARELVKAREDDDLLVLLALT